MGLGCENFANFCTHVRNARERGTTDREREREGNKEKKWKEKKKNHLPLTLL